MLFVPDILQFGKLFLIDLASITSSWTCPLIFISKIFSIYIFRTVVVQYFTRREEEDRDDPFWHTGTGWQLDHSQDDLGLIELQFPFRCSQHSDQFKIRGELTNRLNEDSDYVYQECSIPFCSNVKVFHWPPFVCSFHNKCQNQRAQLSSDGFLAR